MQRAGMAAVLCLTLAMIPSTVHPASVLNIVSIQGACRGMQFSECLGVSRHGLRLRGGQDKDFEEDIAASVEKFAGRNSEMKLKPQEIARVSRKVATREKKEQAPQEAPQTYTLQEFKVGTSLTSVRRAKRCPVLTPFMPLPGWQDVGGGRLIETPCSSRAGDSGEKRGR